MSPSRFRNDLVKAFKDVLDYNASVSHDEAKYHFGTGDEVTKELRGAPITRTALGQLVHAEYPVFDPYSGASFAVERQQEAEIWSSRARRHRQGQGVYREFYDKARTAIRHLNDDDYPVEQAQQVADVFHRAASTSPATTRSSTSSTTHIRLGARTS